MDRDQGQFGAASSELRELVRAVCEETLTAAQRDRLEELLRHNEEARMFYLAHVDMSARIQFMFRGGDSAANDNVSDLASAFPAAAPARLRREESEGPSIRMYVRWTLLAACIAGGALLAYQRLGDESAAPQAQVADANAVVASLRRVVDAEWDGAPPDARNPVFTAGSQLRMKRGLAELMFANDTVMVVEGPAVLELQSDMSVVLHSGKVSAEVPDKAIGFTVQTPRANIVDRGTSFGASVDAEGRTEVQVFKGKVDTEVRDPAEESPRFFQVNEGEALNIGFAKEAIVALSTNPDAFPRLPPLSRAQLWNVWQMYRNRILQDKDLVAYWSFDDRDARDLSPNNNHGFPMNSPAYSADVPPVLGGGMCLDVSAGPKFVQVSHSKSLDIKDTLTIAFWVRGADQQQNWSRIVGKGEMMNCSGWVIHRACDLNQVRTVVGNKGYCNQSIANVKGVYDNAWHHLAVVLNRGFWQVYLDGDFHSHGTYIHSDGLANKAELIIGAAGQDQVMVGSLDFEGQLDEMCLFRRALSADEIRWYYRGGRIEIQPELAQRQSVGALIAAESRGR